MFDWLFNFFGDKSSQEIPKIDLPENYCIGKGYNDLIGILETDISQNSQKMIVTQLIARLFCETQIIRSELEFYKAIKEEVAKKEAMQEEEIPKRKYARKKV